MKKLLLIFAAALIVTACGDRTNKATATADEVSDGDRIEVLYFYGKKRCVTCNAIESLTKEILEQEYAGQVAEGSIVFRSIDISNAENRNTAARYEVSWSSLFINEWRNGEETPYNLTGFGFQYAKNHPEQFKAGIREKLNELLAR